MNIGRFEIEQLSEGIFEIFEDGLIQKSTLSEIKEDTNLPGLRDTSQYIGINPLLIRDGKHNVLVDTGLGWGLDHKSSYTDTSNLLTNLDIFGLTPADITHVVLSHLHYDHSAGSTYVDHEMTTQPTMSYANYFLQKKEWYFALEETVSGNQRPGAGYQLDELYKLAAEDKLVLLTDQHFELLPGIKIIRTGGHTPGHQIIKVQDAGETAYFLGDLIPSEFHLNHYAMRKMDVDSIESKKAKTLILRQALKENAVLLFYHSLHAKAGKLVLNNNKKFALKDLR